MVLLAAANHIIVTHCVPQLIWLLFQVGRSLQHRQSGYSSHSSGEICSSNWESESQFQCSQIECRRWYRIQIQSILWWLLHALEWQLTLTVWSRLATDNILWPARSNLYSLSWSLCMQLASLLGILLISITNYSVMHVATYVYLRRQIPAVCRRHQRQRCSS